MKPVFCLGGGDAARFTTTLKLNRYVAGTFPHISLCLNLYFAVLQHISNLLLKNLSVLQVNIKPFVVVHKHNFIKPPKYIATATNSTVNKA
jgi:hypothetical protein